MNDLIRQSFNNLIKNSEEPGGDSNQKIKSSSLKKEPPKAEAPVEEFHGVFESRPRVIRTPPVGNQYNIMNPGVFR